jgi:hypothetical protein
MCIFAITTLKLAKKLLQAELELEQSVLGISTVLKPWQVAWHMNQTLGFALERDEDLSLLLGRAKTLSYFQKFKFELPELESVLYLVANTGSAGKLVPEYGSTFDYFILYDEIDGLLSERQLLKGLKNIRDFTVVVPIKADEKLRSKQHLVF